VGEAADMIRKELSSRRIQPRVVTGAWVDECWKESTLLDEEQFVIP
jgi:DNA ligase-4